MASAKCKVESGIQLLARLTKKAGIERFYPTIFQNGPKLGDFIEIYSEESASSLIADLICESLIPNDLGGSEANIIVYNTDGKLTLDHLMNLAKSKLLKRMQWPSNKSSKYHLNNVESALKHIFKNLFILDIYETSELYLGIQNLEFYLTQNPNISLIIFDTLAAFYWDEQISQKVTKMDTYVKRLLRIIQKIAKDFKVTVIYSRPEYFSTSKQTIENLEPCCENTVLEQINYRIQIVYNVNGTNYVNVRSFDKQFKKEFIIIKDEITWL